MSLPALGVDLGGTKLRLGLVDLDGAVTQSVTTHPEGDDLVSAVLLSVDRFEGSFSSIGVAVPGLVRDGALLWARGLTKPQAFGEPLKERFGVPVGIINDADAAGIAEARFGAAQGRRLAVAVVVGTGIGGSITLDGSSLSTNPMSGEFGHMQVLGGDSSCGCGLASCWSSIASGSTLDDWAVQAGLGSSGADVAALASSGNQEAQRLMNQLGSNIGRGLANVLLTLDPDIVTIGGGVGSSANLGLLEAIRKSAAENMHALGHRTVAPIVYSELGNNAGIIGASMTSR